MAELTALLKVQRRSAKCCAAYSYLWIAKITRTNQKKKRCISIMFTLGMNSLSRILVRPFLDFFGWKTERGALDCFAFVLFALFPYPTTLFGVACRAQFLFFEGLNQIFGYAGLPLFFGCMIEKRNFKKQTKRTKTCYFGEVWKLGEGINFHLMGVST